MSGMWAIDGGDAELETPKGVECCKLFTKMAFVIKSVLLGKLPAWLGRKRKTDGGMI